MQLSQFIKEFFSLSGLAAMSAQDPPESVQLVNAFFNHLNPLSLLLLNSWQTYQLTKMESNRAKAKDEIKKMFLSNREEVRKYQDECRTSSEK